MKQEYIERRMADGEEIRVGIFEPGVAARGVVQLVHGFGEYIGHYLTVIDFLVDQDFVVVMHDQRGHGLHAAERPKTRGIALSYHKFIDDVLEIRQWIGQEYSELPVFLMGHSLGGNIVLNVLLEKPELYEKAVVESPWLDLAHAPGKALQVIAGLAGKISPKIRVHTGLKLEAVAHDHETVRLVTKDGIYHDFLSLRLFSQIKAAGHLAAKQAGTFKLPILLFCAEKDDIVSAPAIREFARNAGENVTLVEIKDGFHALHLDTQAAQVMARIKDFLRTENEA